jgi:hypothetical protein
MRESDNFGHLRSIVNHTAGKNGEIRPLSVIK